MKNTFFVVKTKLSPPPPARTFGSINVQLPYKKSAPPSLLKKQFPKLQKAVKVITQGDEGDGLGGTRPVNASIVSRFLPANICRRAFCQSNRSWSHSPCVIDISEAAPSGQSCWHPCHLTRGLVGVVTWRRPWSGLRNLHLIPLGTYYALIVGEMSSFVIKSKIRECTLKSSQTSIPYKST